MLPLKTPNHRYSSSGGGTFSDQLGGNHPF